MAETDSSQLRRQLPSLIFKALQERGIGDDEILIATDTDLDIAGEYCQSWVIVTRERVLVYMVDREADVAEALMLKDVPIERIETARTDTRVGSGFLEAKTNGVYEEIARYSNRNGEKFAKVAQRVKQLAAGKQVQIEESEAELRKGVCQQCGARLPDRSSKVCPKCLKRGMVFMRFLARTKDFWPYATIAMVLVIITIMVQLVPAQLVRVLLDDVLGERTPPPWLAAIVNTFGLTTKYQWLWLLVGMLFAVTAIGSVVGIFRETLAAWMANKLAFDLRQEVFRKMEDLAVRYHDMHPVGQLMTRCTQDIEALQGFINQLTSGFAYQLLLVIGVAAAMFSMNWWLALCAIAPAPLVMGFTAIYYKRIVPRWQKYWTTRSTLSNVLHGSLTGIRVVKAFAQEGRESARFDRYSGRFRDAGLSVGYATARFGPMVGFIFQLGSFGIWLIGGTLVLHAVGRDAPGALSLGTLVAFLNYLGMFYAPLNSLTQMSTWFTSFTTQAHRVFEVLDEQPEVDEPDDAVDIEIQGGVRFQNVTFGYDPHIPILKDVSFSIQPGEMIGIVGHSGCGKSTTVNLIMRFYNPQEGRITIDDTDIQKIRKQCVRRQIGLVAQDPFLFRGTIAENIAYGNPKVAPELILNAALAANAHMFITRIHDGYDTLLGERGSGLSGGERQRVAIARALLHNPRILILDEATSSVDAIAESEIQRALEALSRGRTTIAIAHRLSTLRNSDRIIVFEEGEIREQGTHDELMALDGIYKKLVDIQTQLTGNSLVEVADFKSLDRVSARIQRNGEDSGEDVEKRREAVAKKNVERQRLEVPRIRYLDAKELHLNALPEGGMRVTYKDEEYEHVHAYSCFPIGRPNEYIALWTGSTALEHEEIGMILRLKELAPSSRMAVELELKKRYFIHYVHRIVSIQEDVGFLTWKVETNKGDQEFMTKRWERGSVIEAGAKGRIIFDIDNNRYEIEDLEAIDPASKALFLKYIYW